MVNDKPLILLVEDNEKIREANRRVLEGAGYHVAEAGSLVSARASLWRKLPDVIILDIMLPDGNGLDFITEIREVTNAPVLLLTSLNERDERIAGLKAGGDDYITKPYDIDELSARVSAFLRREQMRRKTDAGAARIIEKGPIKLDILLQQAFLYGNNIRLTPREFSLLLYFVQNEDVILPMRQIYEEIWSAPMMEDSGALKTSVSRLRAKLSLSGYSIESERGEGYRFVGLGV